MIVAACRLTFCVTGTRQGPSKCGSNAKRGRPGALDSATEGTASDISGQKRSFQLYATVVIRRTTDMDTHVSVQPVSALRSAGYSQVHIPSFTTVVVVLSD